jgi:hypothetical protein
MVRKEWRLGISNIRHEDTLTAAAEDVGWVCVTAIVGLILLEACCVGKIIRVTDGEDEVMVDDSDCSETVVVVDMVKQAVGEAEEGRYMLLGVLNWDITTGPANRAMS